MRKYGAIYPPEQNPLEDGGEYFAFFVYDGKDQFPFFFQSGVRNGAIGTGNDMLTHFTSTSAGPFTEPDIVVKFKMGKKRTPDPCEFTIIRLNSKKVNIPLLDSHFFADIDGIFHGNDEKENSKTSSQVKSARRISDESDVSKQASDNFVDMTSDVVDLTID